MRLKRKQASTLAILLGLELLLTGCSTLPGMRNVDTVFLPEQKLPSVPNMQPTLVPITASLLNQIPADTYVYRIAPQDVLSISIWQHPEFNVLFQPTATTSTPSSQAAGQTGYLVDAAGRIYFPLIGYLAVAGKTVGEVQTEISQQLARYVRDPQVIVRVADYRSKKIYVLGEVNKPGLLPLNDQVLTIADALMLTGSLNPDTADPGHIYVIRGNLRSPKIYWLNAGTPEAMLLAERFALQPNDVMYVSAAPVARWNRFLNQLLPSLQTVWYTKTVTNN